MDIISNLISGFGLMFSITNIGAIFIGVIFGSILGALPGLTATMGIAIILPMTFGMEPVTAFAMLLGAYKGGTFAGSIPAILINTPGTPAAAATMLDGYPMAKKGQANLAMSTALSSSVIADFIGTIFLIFTSVYLVRIALLFGPAEYTTLIIFSLTIVAGLSGESLLKGIISALIGFLLALIGLDPMSGLPRMTFGIPYLMEGLDLMVVMIALFALSEIFIQARSKKTGTISEEIDSSSLKLKGLNINNLKKDFKAIVKGSIIGVIIGAIPGLGATPAAFLSYSEAKRTSKTPELFGTGISEGVAAVESANNATCSATLIPLLSLGVPGNVTAAVLLGGLMMHGLTPGPRLFTENATTVYAIFAGLLMSGIVLFIVGTQTIKLFSLITRVPRAVVFPVALILCTIGTYGLNQSFIDLFVLSILGIVGYFLRKNNFALAPLLITFILVPIGERSFRQAYSLAGGDITVFFTRPISLMFIILTVISAIFVVKRQGQIIKEK